jgi:hypothetical protein
MAKTSQKPLLDRIDNWARWARSDGDPQMTCASAERFYVPPRPDEQKAAAGARAPIDERDAELLERAYQAIPYPLERVFLRLWYVRRSPVKKIAKAVQLRPALLESFNQRCLLDLGNSLRLLEHQEALALRNKSPYNRQKKTDLPSFPDELAA